MTSHEDCALCQLTGGSVGSQLPSAEAVIAYIDAELIGLIPEGGPGVLLALREHTGTLSDTPERSAAILAPLRRIVERVKSSYGVDEATILPTTDLAGAAGHVCYRVVPVLAGRSDVQSDTATRAAELAETLRRAAADRRQPPGARPDQAPTLRRPH